MHRTIPVKGTEASRAPREQTLSRKRTIILMAAKKKSADASAKTGFVESMECMPVTRLPEGEEWSYEIKLDGYRYLGHRSWSANAGHIFRREPSSAEIEHCHDSPAR
jgi:hypothetical protein